MSDPERIWLQPGAETTWCKDRINDDDVEYVRADIAAATIGRLTRERNEARYNEAVQIIAAAESEQALAKAREALTRVVRERDEARGMEDSLRKDLKTVGSTLAAELAKAREAIEYAHAHGFEWPSDPLAAPAKPEAEGKP